MCYVDLRLAIGVSDQRHAKKMIYTNILKLFDLVDVSKVSFHYVDNDLSNIFYADDTQIAGDIKCERIHTSLEDYGIVLAYDNLESTNVVGNKPVYTVDTRSYWGTYIDDVGDFNTSKVFHLPNSYGVNTYCSMKYGKDDHVGRVRSDAGFMVYITETEFPFVNTIIKLYNKLNGGIFKPSYVDLKTLYDFRSTRLLALYGKRAIKFNKRQKKISICGDQPVIISDPPLGLLMNGIRRLGIMQVLLMNYLEDDKKETKLRTDITDSLFNKKNEIRTSVKTNELTVTLNDIAVKLEIGNELPNLVTMKKMLKTDDRVVLVLSKISEAIFEYYVIVSGKKRSYIYGLPFCSVIKKPS
jgi:hypothetical protein